MEKINERLKLLRRQKKITQEQMAELVGVSPQAVSRWECGVTCPDIASLPRIAEILGISVDELLGVNEKEKRREINSIIADAEAKIDCGVTAEPIIALRSALNKYPSNDRLLCSLMYALYVACEDEELVREYDAEIISIANRIDEFSPDDDCRNEARRILFRHYCDTGRKADAVLLADRMASIETCLERNIYWVLEGEDRLSYLRERIADDLKYLLWDIRAYSTYAEMTESERTDIETLCESIESTVKDKF